MQTRFAFDTETLGKIMRGSMIAFTGAGAIAALNYIGAIEVGDPLVASIIAWAVPTAVNAIKEWQRGI